MASCTHQRNKQWHAGVVAASPGVRKAQDEPDTAQYGAVTVVLDNMNCVINSNSSFSIFVLVYFCFAMYFCCCCRCCEKVLECILRCVCVTEFNNYLHFLFWKSIEKKKWTCSKQASPVSIDIVVEVHACMNIFSSHTLASDADISQ